MKLRRASSHDQFSESPLPTPGDPLRGEGYPSLEHVTNEPTEDHEIDTTWALELMLTSSTVLGARSMRWPR